MLRCARISSHTALTKRCFSVAPRPMRHMRKRFADESPLGTAFKMGDDEDDEKKPQRFTPNSPDKPNLMSLHKRWHNMDAIEQEEVIIYLDDRARADWRDLDAQEKKAMWFINYGPWGPRAPQPDDPGKIYGYLVGALGLAILAGTGYKFGVQDQKAADEKAHE